MLDGTEGSGKPGLLVPCEDPSRVFAIGREADVSGSATTIAVEGSRCLAVEVQALVAGGARGGGRRTVEGVASNRVGMIMAVLDKRCGVRFGSREVYVNVVGGLKLNRGRGGSGGSDLAVAVALVSSMTGIEVRGDTAFVGEIGLNGEMRDVEGKERRIKEAKRMGFSRVVVPSRFGNYKGGGEGGRGGRREGNRGCRVRRCS